MFPTWMNTRDPLYKCSARTFKELLFAVMLPVKITTATDMFIQATDDHLPVLVLVAQSDVYCLKAKQ